MTESVVAPPVGETSSSPYASPVFGIGVLLFYAAAFAAPQVIHTGALLKWATYLLAFVAGAALTFADSRCSNIWVLFAVGFVQYLVTIVIPDAIDARALLVRDFSPLQPLIVGACCGLGALAVSGARGTLRTQDLNPRVWLTFISPFQKTFGVLERTQKIIQVITFFLTLLFSIIGALRLG